VRFFLFSFIPSGSLAIYRSFELADVFMRFDHIPGLISGAFGPREMLGKRSPTISVKPDKVGAASRR